jgi:predicted O-linked N-acetylglucosamine transferase (SPINDLY family)/predicted SAM-dependent methyltransferase
MHSDNADSRERGRWSWRRIRQALGAPGAPAAQAGAAPGADALYERGIAAERAQQGDEAVAFYRAAVDGKPDDAEFRYALAAALNRCRRVDEALAEYRAGLALQPDHARMRVDLGLALMSLGRLEEAQSEMEQARRLAPDLAEAHHNLGLVHHQLGRLDDAIREVRRAHELMPGHAGIHSNLLFILNYSARYSPAEICAEHRRYADLQVQPVASPAPDPVWPRRLRIGYVSPDFRSHVVSSFILPAFARHDRQRFEVFAYYCYPEADEVSEAMRALADQWLDCAQLSDAELAARIRADRIDILVDLAGHTVHNRLRTFALRPAPVQATYLGYPNTTGLKSIDYRITDAKADPPGEADRLNAERLLRLPRSFLCYRPGPDLKLPAVGSAAAPAAGITFGCFNNFQKLSDKFFAAAARILAAVPDSRLLLKAKPLGTPSVAQRVRAGFAAQGIDPARVELLGWQPSPESHIATYARVDIALDSFPYNGTTTTCEALWMGVPVVTLRGDRHAGRVGASLLDSVGLGELIGEDLADYERIAVRLAGDRAALAALRGGLRERMRQSVLRDEPGFVRELEEGYLGMWRERLASAAAPAGAMPDAQAALAAARALHEGGQAAQAKAACEDILRRQPAQAEAIALYWDLCHELGEDADAVDRIGHALAVDGGTAQLHYMLACTLQDLARPAEAQAAYHRALELDPGHARAANNLGCLQEAQGEVDAAEASYGRALRADPRLANALHNRGNLHRLRGRHAEAEADLRAALAIDASLPDWHCGLAEVLLLRWRLDEAVASQRAALDLDASNARAHFGLGNALMLLGRIDEAEAAFRRAVDLQPDLAEAHSNLLLCLHYRKGNEGAALHAEHLAWAKRHAAGLAQDAGRAGHLAIARDGARRLNIGYVSPNFHRHSVASFFEPLLAAHDRSRFRVFCYSSVEHPDAVTERLKGMCDGWRELRGVPGDAAARLIREDRIDILVDLAGHTGGGRPLLFARKPAPLQLAWLGYPNTTGLAEMDYRLTDAEADPAGTADALHTEKLLRLPQGFLCFAPEADAPEPGPLPARAKGAVTFGSFNNLAKLTAEMIALWSRLLLAVPGSSIVLKAHALGAQSARRAVLDEFARAGVGAERVVLHGPEDSAAGHLGRYREIDIALDTFPYNGTTTTCEALWMGVPVVTLAGATHVSRVGASLLRRVGLGELVADGAEDYLSRARTLAADLDRLAALRQGLRQRLRASPLLDAAAFARAVESAYRKIWSDWLAGGRQSPVLPSGGEPLRLHVGGKERKDGWKVLNIQPGPDVDFVGSCTDLGQFADGSVRQIYASHVLEHLGYKADLPRALAEFHRVLAPGGTALISVPDFEQLCRLFLDPRLGAEERLTVMRMAFGGQMDEHDFHHVGLSYEFLAGDLGAAGFSRVERVADLGVFHDDSRLEVHGEKISLNVVATK